MDGCWQSNVEVENICSGLLNPDKIDFGAVYFETWTTHKKTSSKSQKRRHKKTGFVETFSKNINLFEDF